MSGESIDNMLPFPMLKEDHATIWLNSSWTAKQLLPFFCLPLLPFFYNQKKMTQNWNQNWNSEFSKSDWIFKIRIEMTSILHASKNVGFLPVNWLNIIYNIYTDKLTIYILNLLCTWFHAFANGRNVYCHKL